MSDVLSILSTCVLEGDLDNIASLTQQALDSGLDVQTVLNEGLMPGMDHVGVEFRAGNMFVPEVLRSSRALQSAMDILKPLLVESGAERRGKVLLGTVQGDLHNIGKNLVGMMCEGAGFEIIDLGKDVSPEDFVEGVKKHEPHIVGMSALLTTTMRAMEHTINALEEAGVRDQVKIIVGGAPLTQEFAAKIGADGYASNAASAAEMAKKFVSAT